MAKPLPTSKFALCCGSGIGDSTQLMTKKLVKLIVGWTFLILGILGLFLPILQGVLFTAVGLVILAEESKFVKKLLQPLERKYPKQFEKVHEFQNSVYRKVHALIQRVATVVPEFRSSLSRKFHALFHRKKSATPETPPSIDKD